MIVLNSRFLSQNLTGVQRYGYELLKQIEVSKLDINYAMPFQDCNSIYQIHNLDSLEKNGNFQNHLWEQIDLPSYLKTLGKPLLLNLCNTAPWFYKNQIVTVHDLSVLRGNWHSKAFKLYYKSMLPRILKNSVHIITVSEFSKLELIKMYSISEDKITVIYNAPFNISAQTTLDTNVVFDKPYVLSVGSMDQRKNLKRVIKAFLGLQQSDVCLYLTGTFSSNFKSDPELTALIDTNKSQIVFLGYVSDSTLIQLYKNALCFVYPSLYEGFGLPPLEAMYYGCPVIVSNVSSLPEVCGDAALYCDPLNEKDIQDKLAEMIKLPVLRAKLTERGILNAEKYSWQLSGQKLITLLEKYN
jgi:glycosyltransferase involved in cell wall biosynthesis